ncbi:hypothetical protein O7635_01640 [Asanoa sp. WMMD1127]|uniref:hypothetical protein n=1 Tax=Asanoa sp. WMMD1127 TaxID=3016107 RepID=UPI00241796D8|nr:hypothetical protein [Asanoa sp. WMMD1127]MDG4820555.1 hypothetical protein [Asanoa sp. WMMD1127]
MTQPPPVYGPPPPPPPPRSMPVWPWLVGGAVVFVLILCLGGVGLFVALRESGPDSRPAPPRAASAEPMPRVTPGPDEGTRLPDPPRVMGSDATVSGRGSRTVDVDLEPDAVYVATITHDGASNFMVEGLGDGGRPLSLIVNAIGDYSGDRTVGLSERETPVAFRVRAQGTWKIVLRDLSKAPAFRGEASGRKPAVFIVPEGTRLPPRLTATHSGRDNFVVRGYGDDDGIGLFVNEIGRYRGTTSLPPDTSVIEVEAQGGWTLEATT